MESIKSISSNGEFYSCDFCFYTPRKSKSRKKSLFTGLLEKTPEKQNIPSYAQKTQSSQRKDVSFKTNKYLTNILHALNEESKDLKSEITKKLQHQKKKKGVKMNPLNSTSNNPSYTSPTFSSEKKLVSRKSFSENSVKKDLSDVFNRNKTEKNSQTNTLNKKSNTYTQEANYQKMDKSPSTSNLQVSVADINKSNDHTDSEFDFFKDQKDSKNLKMEASDEGSFNLFEDKNITIESSSLKGATKIADDFYIKSTKTKIFNALNEKHSSNESKSDSEDLMSFKKVENTFDTTILSEQGNNSKYAEDVDVSENSMKEEIQLDKPAISEYNEQLNQEPKSQIASTPPTHSRVNKSALFLILGGITAAVVAKKCYGTLSPMGIWKQIRPKPQVLQLKV